MPRTVGLLLAAAGLAAIAPASAAGSAFTSPLRGTSFAAAGTAYGGAALKGKRMAYPSLGMLVRPDGRLTARDREGEPARLSWLDAALRAAERECARRARRDAAAMPPPRSVFHGLTAQSAGGVRLPISLTATHNGKVWANWDATMNCRPGTFPMTNVTPITKIRPDGTFTRSERYVIRYKGGLVDHFRVKLTGAFRADGATGTLEARVRTTQPGHRFRPCASGKQAWAARG